MFVTISAAVVAICALVVLRYFALKTRLTEKSIDEAINRRLLASPVMAELCDLREVNGVMRNLLIDFVESEDIKPATSEPAKLPPDERKRLISMREERRREIYAEALVLLRQTNVPRAKVAVD
ncbi:hypothetical protein QTL95_21810 [Rhizobium sp. S152]|uniref:hypothetical protein n=1 Tax=Rhizobium sp. S152 TaxID=3055038 RepID=UPI0025AA0A9B|nr:hypothetical protein [Rhizobium sp. S152]MDM9628538.1 hypothetical protein [Rhizobium sp. S152]